LASLLSMFLYNLIKYIYVKIRLGFDPFTWGVGKILLVGIGSWAITQYALPSQTIVWLDILIRSGLMILLYGVGSWSLHIAPEVEGWIKEKAGELLSKS